MRCMNSKMFIGLAVAGLAVFLLVPGAGRSLGPLLLVAACPLSMIFMMRGMGAGGRANADTCATKPTLPSESPQQKSEEIAELRARLAELEARNAGRSSASSGPANGQTRSS